MGQIFIINDFSQSQPWLHCLLAANGGILRKSGIDLAPFNPWTTETTPHHCHLWLPYEDERLLPGWAAQQWHEMAQTLDQGRDLLILAHTPWLEAHKYFYETLNSKLAGHAVRALFIIGNPLAVLEQRYRDAIFPLPAATGDFFAKSYVNCAGLFEIAAKHPYSDKVCALPNVASGAASAPMPAIADKVGAFLGCGNFESPAHFPLEPLFYKSHETRILAKIASVRFNAWPRLDEGAYAAALEEFDAPRSETVCAPLPLRLEMAESLKVMEREALPGCDFSFPPPPDFLLSEEGLPVDAPLSREAACAFAKILPQEAAEVLRDRYRLDLNLLSENQKTFYGALCALPTNDFSRIGEPLEPVEVAVLTMSYNHESYIAECMDSVLAQRSGFPVRHIILDHCSTDGTAAIIEDYARRHSSIQPVLLSRRAHPENVEGLFLRCRAKYAALCDGDDYFTEPLKLAKQVDFLEKNPYHAISFHPVAVTYENGESPGIFPPLDMLPRNPGKSFYLSDLFHGNFIQTNSVVYRWRFQKGLPDWFRSDLCPGDWYWHLLHAETGKIGMIREVMSVYRRHGKSLFNNSFNNALEHRRVHGMAELETYKAVYDHFGESCFTHLAKIANGVFANFMEISLNENDSALLDRACGMYPRFAKFFLASLQIVKARKTEASKAEIM